MQSICTSFWLPPAPPSTSVVRELLRRIFEEYRWFQPLRYGRVFTDERLNPRHLDYDALVNFYSMRRSITVLARTDRDFIMLSPTLPDAPPFVGTLTWYTSVAEAGSAEWRQAHLHQVAEVMRLMDSPLAQTGTADDLDRKTLRLIPNPDGFGSRETFTVRDPSEGLAGLYWRNFFGPPFVRMFGARLLSLPPGTHQELGDGHVLVQPYELPTQALTPEGAAAEHRLITVLGPECFYDHEQHRRPTRLPELLPIAP
jgi:hypothetical protein